MRAIREQTDITQDTINSIKKSAAQGIVDLQLIFRQPEKHFKSLLNLYTNADLKAVIASHGGGSEPGQKSVLFKPKPQLIDMILVCPLCLLSPMVSCPHMSPCEDATMLFSLQG